MAFVAGTEPLVTKLSYMIARLHKDMYMVAQAEVTFVHQVLIQSQSKQRDAKEIVCKTTILSNRNKMK